MQGILISADIESLNCLGMLDIPVQKNRIHSLHVLFTLYSEFKNSQVSFCIYLPQLKPLDQYNGACMGFHGFSSYIFVFGFSLFLKTSKYSIFVIYSIFVYIFVN